MIYFNQITYQGIYMTPQQIGKKIYDIFATPGPIPTDQIGAIDIAISRLNCEEFRILIDYPLPIQSPTMSAGSPDKLIPQKTKPAKIRDLPVIAEGGPMNRGNPDDIGIKSHPSQQNVGIVARAFAKILKNHPCWGKIGSFNE